MYNLELDKLGGDFKSLLLSIRGGRPTSAFSLTLGAKIHVTSELDGRKLFVATDRLAARDYADKFKAYLGDGVVLIPERDDPLLHRKAVALSTVYERVSAYYKLITGDFKVAVIPAEGLLSYYPRADLLLSRVIKLKVEEELSPLSLKDKLVAAGYAQADEGETGCFTVRGDVTEVFLPDGRGLRISFFDEIIEQLKLFNADTRESISTPLDFTVLPATDLFISDAAAVDKKLSKIGDDDGLNDIVADLRYKLSLNPDDAGMVWLTPFIRDDLCSIFEYVDGATLVFDEAKVLFDKLKLTETELRSRVKSLTEGGGVTPEHRYSLISADDALSLANGFKGRLAFQQITSVNPLFTAQALFNFRCQPVTRYFLDNAALITDLKNYNVTGYKVILCCRDEKHVETVKDNLGREDLFVYTDAAEIGTRGVLASTYNVPCGFIYHSLKLIVIGREELVGKPKQISVFKQKRQLITPKRGDYVVHEVHGIGICEGTERLKISDIEKDYVVLRYREGDTLYVPVDQLDMLEKYSGDENPKLNKIGGKEFARQKDKVKQSVKKLAIDLVTLYNERQKLKGYAYAPDSELQQEFEDAFEFDETDDQLEAVKAIKDDMEHGRLMDRLICGDVGFGKTEVAFRAVFKTVYENKQAAILAPTTILAKQHYNTLQARLRGWGLKVELLTRFQSKAEIDRSLQNLELGVANIVVGTHRLLSKDVRFYDLGLLVLDEEQRFGVEHKEKLKLFKKDVNILTLSATPIPRTLSMALNGIRDISLLETPPVNRLPIQTYVVEYSDTLLGDAVKRELNRGGQVFILYNYVDTIDAFAARVRSIVGEVPRIIVAHGQMPPATLDERITRFYQKEGDILIATTIIENGIDLPDANTLLVYDADRLGLAQLYQLRGRVGRSGALAHAYFTTRENKVLSEDAAKRLAALMDYTEFGSGFKIALRDLEIRGAGNVLGAEQHGHISTVGYEMYAKLLKEAVDEIKNNVTPKSGEVEMKVDVNAYVSENYVSHADKLRIYKLIADIRTRADRDGLIAALTDTYGAPDDALLNLLDVAYLKSLVADVDGSRVIINKRGAAVQFASESIFANADLMAAVATFSRNTVLTPNPPQLMFDTKNRTSEGVLKDMLAFFEAAGGII